MARKTIYIPDELLAELHKAGEAGNLSRLFQQYLRQHVLPGSSAAVAMSIRRLTEPDVLSVISVWDAAGRRLWGHPLDEREVAAVQASLSRMLDNDQAFCLVAEQRDAVVGFVTVALHRHPTMPGVDAEIEELTAVDDDDVILDRLVAEAMQEARRRGAGVLTHSVPREYQWSAARRVLHRNGWEDDLITFTHYPT
jgi:hypothetical protein